MSCPNCGLDNRPGAKFCSECGDALEITCPVCSFVSPPDANFCSNCGHSFTAEERPKLGEDITRYVPPEMLSKITAARAANPMRGERRTVTMLFADIQGSTAAAEGLDPEDWTDIINGAFEHLIAPVYRYEGTLARLLGDAVLAFFGAPIAHEDDPVRAVRAGLEIVEAMERYKTEIKERWEIPIDVRVGINTGLVVVGEVGSDLRVEYTALGDAVNVAARMEQTAEPGTVRVTRDTWALVKGHFEGEEIGPVEVKGKSEPVDAVRVIGRGRGGADTTGERPLIGRSAELARLETLQSRLLDGAGWVASVMGEAGLGKSRLLDEFRAAWASDAQAKVAWRGSFSESYDAAIPYSSIRQLLRRWWDIDGAGEPYRVVEQAVDEVVPDLPDAAAYLGYAASVPLPDSVNDFLAKLDAPVLDARARQAVVSYVEAESRRRPVLVAFEDIHWADPISLAVIEDMMQITERSPLGLLFTMRPYRDEPPWHLHEIATRDHPHRYEALDLSALEGQAAESLFDALVDGLDVPAELRGRILERSDGNPLFIEQMARALREGDGDLESVPVPTGLNSLLTARLDRLGAESRMVVQIASVIGSEFDRPTLAALVDDASEVDPKLTDLLRREILVERGGHAGLLAFHHALMQEAAYSTMLLRTRRELHGRLAEHLVATSPGAVQEIARNFVEARDMERAFPHLIAAGEQASRAMALSDAIRLFTTALDNLPGNADPELVVKGHDGLGVAYTLVPDLTRSAATYQRLVDYADLSGRPSAKVRALNRMAINTAMLTGDLASARGYLDDAYTLAQEVGDEFGLAQYHMNACTIAGLGGDMETSVAHDSETARWGKELGAEGIRVEGLARLAENSVWLMDFERAIPAAEEAIDAARQAGDELNLAIVNAVAMSRLSMRDGDNPGALRLLLENEDSVARYASFYAPMVKAMAAYHLYERGEIEAALTYLEDARAMATAAHTPFFGAVAASALAKVYGSLRLDEAMIEARTAAISAVDSPLGGFVGSTVWSELGYASLVTG
ncbi:MAG: adenylate/guanylate cyclase domain-containing protein, partial [Acidimicrobiia bacterium]